MQPSPLHMRPVDLRTDWSAQTLHSYRSYATCSALLVPASASLYLQNPDPIRRITRDHLGPSSAETLFSGELCERNLFEALDHIRVGPRSNGRDQRFDGKLYFEEVCA